MVFSFFVDPAPGVDGCDARHFGWNTIFSKNRLPLFGIMF
jgi:hypothetical protein